MDFSLREATPGESDKMGASHVTAVFVREGYDLRSTIEHLSETGQLESARAVATTVARDDVSASEVVAFAVATYAKGWLVECLLADTDRFSKGSVSNDQAGQDFFDRESGKYVQVKCVTYKSQEDDHIYYQFDMRGGIHFGENVSEVVNAAADVSGRVGRGKDLQTTLTYRADSRYRNSNRPSVTSQKGGTYRYMWW
jgi:hypothetical protein